MPRSQRFFDRLLSQNKKTSKNSKESETNAIRIISDSYVKGSKQTWNHEGTGDFDRKILAVNNMYGWLYKEGILKNVSFEMKDYSDITYFALDAKTLLPYRSLMEKSGVPDAALAVHHIFDEAYTPCLYSGAIELGWTMMSYRDFDGTISRSWECDLVKHLDAHSVLDIEEIRQQEGIRAAVHAVFELSGFEPSDLTIQGLKLTVRPLEERDIAAVKELDEQSGNSVAPMLDGNDDFAWGVFKGEELVGYCTIGYAEDAYEGIVFHPGYTNDSLLLSEVYVSPANRGEGCASYMVDRVIKRRTENDKQIVLLTILDDRLSNFYERIGFKSLGDGVMLRDERSIYDIKRDEAFEKAFSYFSRIDLSMADKREYLYGHADKLIFCFEHDHSLDLLDVDCWVRFEVLLGRELSHEEYKILNEYIGDLNPHDIEENDFKTIDGLKAALNTSPPLTEMVETAARQTRGGVSEDQRNERNAVSPAGR